MGFTLSGRSDEYPRKAKSRDQSKRASRWSMSVLRPTTGFVLAGLVGACTEPMAPTIAPVAPPAAVSTAGQIPNGVVVRSDGTVEAQADSNFVETSRKAMQGAKLPNGACRLASNKRVVKGDSGVSRVAEFNPNTCAFVRANGHWRVPPARQGVPRGPTVPRGDRISASRALGGPRVPRFDYNSNSWFEYVGPLPYEMMGVWQNQYSRDPVDLWVTRRTFQFQWTWNTYNSRVNPGSSEVDFASRAETGWLPPQHVFTWLTTSEDWWETGQRSTANFLNPFFCLLTSTFVRYDASVMGYVGYAHIDWSYEVAGVCGFAWLDTFHEYYVW